MHANNRETVYSAGSAEANKQSVASELYGQFVTISSPSDSDSQINTRLFHFRGNATTRQNSHGPPGPPSPSALTFCNLKQSNFP